MIRLLYISTARVPHSRAQLDNILGVSRRNNAAVGITGLLIAGGNRFLQVLEGPEAHVQETYDRIRLDIRHFAPVILKREAAEKRLFGRWAMGFQPGGTPAGMSSMSDEVCGLVAPIGDPLLKAYFEGFARRHAA
jgi:hypothetical protein